MLAVSLTQTGALLGTPPYMAPEQHEAVDADARTDQYSFCVSLFEALYGYRPFHGDNYRSLVLSILDGEIRERPVNTEVPDSLHQVILRGLCVDRADRFESMDELLKALSRFVEGTTTNPGTWRAPSSSGEEQGTSQVTRPNWGKEEAEKKASKNYRGGWVAAIVIAAIGGLIAGWAVIKSEQSSPSPSLLNSNTSNGAVTQDGDDASVLLSPTTKVVIDAGADGPPDANETKPPRRSSITRRGTSRRGTRKKRDSDLDTPPVKANSSSEMSAAEKAAERRRRQLNLDLKGTTP